ncbi:hypothetical protein CDD83_8372 [Cordyceps sp. RAO-2017]|nr:hypothetical protein CDD83_8372 [Cordyceps sp. RAO-2017]
MARRGFLRGGSSGRAGARSARMATWSTKPAATICLSALTCRGEGGSSRSPRSRPAKEGMWARSSWAICRRSCAISRSTLSRTKWLAHQASVGSCANSPTTCSSLMASDRSSRKQKLRCTSLKARRASARRSSASTAAFVRSALPPPSFSSPSCPPAGTAWLSGRKTSPAADRPATSATVYGRQSCRWPTSRMRAKRGASGKTDMVLPTAVTWPSADRAAR